MISVQQEGLEIVNALESVLPTTIVGSDAILQLKNSGSKNWRQMEWIGFWFEDAAAPALRTTLKGRSGPRYGNTEFDYQREHVWDLKAHPLTNANGTPNSVMICNDCEAVDACIRDWGGVGFVIVHGHATFDWNGEFKRWHDMLKGGISPYERERMVRGAQSRARKTALLLTRIEAVFFPSVSDLHRGLDAGWVRHFQAGMRNSNGQPRRAKYALVADQIPRRYTVADLQLYPYQKVN